ncbi:hypothetical protein [Ammoniphilus sp. 3BR4]
MIFVSEGYKDSARYLFKELKLPLRSDGLVFCLGNGFIVERIEGFAIN